MKFRRSIIEKMTLMYIILMFIFNASLFTLHAESQLFDRVVAFVDNEAITLSELSGKHEEALRVFPTTTREEVLQSMINRILLLREAKRYRIEAPTEDDVIREYIDLKVRAFIRISEGEVERFYQQNRDRFKGKTYDEVREDIEAYFIEKELSERLRANLADLRKQAHIAVQFDAP